MSAVLSDAKDAKMFPYFLLALNDIMELCTDNGSHLAAPVAFAGSASTAIVADVQKVGMCQEKGKLWPVNFRADPR